MLKKLISKPVDWVVYSVMGEKQRKQIGDMLSKKQKENITRLLNGKKFRERRKLKALKHHLYNLGFTDQALKDMQKFQVETENNEIKRRSEEHTSELQSRGHLVCRLLLEKKKKKQNKAK